MSGQQQLELGKEVLYSLRAAHGALADLLKRGKPRDFGERERVFGEMARLTGLMGEIGDVVRGSQETVEEEGGQP